MMTAAEKVIQILKKNGCFYSPVLDRYIFKINTINFINFWSYLYISQFPQQVLDEAAQDFSQVGRQFAIDEDLSPWGLTIPKEAVYTGPSLLSFNSPNNGPTAGRNYTVSPAGSVAGPISMEHLTQQNQDRIQSEMKPPCSHKWRAYVGFSETYSYCELCEEKK